MNHTGAVSYLNDPCVMPFCKGCGHTHVVRQLNEALQKLQLDPRDVCLVSDIGCIGLVDSLFASPHTVHTTHGRSTAFATGIELADSVLASSTLRTIVLIGDGGAMIGLLHLINAALLNVDVTVLLCNNFLFGMTGGQNSAFSPVDFVTPTSPRGNVIPPIDMCKMMVDAHAPFVARKLATDKDLADTIAEAIVHPGFSLVEIVELCTEYGLKHNKLSGSALRDILKVHDQPLGVLRRFSERPGFGDMYGQKFPREAERPAEEGDSFLVPRYENRLQREIGIVLAGSAGERVQSAAAMFCEAAVVSGLHCILKTDNPVTQGSGFSLAEIKLGREEIHYSGIERPDAVLVISDDGMSELTRREILQSLPSSAIVVVDSSIGTQSVEGRIIRCSLREMCAPGKAAAAALAAYLAISSIFDVEAFVSILQSKQRTPTAPVFSEAFLSVLKDIQKKSH